ncbi:MULTISPECIES: MarR family winged helix-turn-helix transcriptional regulator [Amycolatopsis]|uniref:MarR family winged helix-turn-helix transcriptional regulator n=1 Tax=Amycolatopsis albidoflavus TaxID=102226 RepID=A0ABW5IAZ7_9PSEU
MTRTTGTEGRPLVPEELSDRVDCLLSKVAEAVRKDTDATFASLDIRGAHHSVLRMLGVCGPLAQKDLAARLRVDSSTIVDLVDQLEGRGLAERRRDLKDRRVYLVELTESGQRLLAAADERVGGLRRDVFAALSAAEYEQLRGLLDKLSTRWTTSA